MKLSVAVFIDAIPCMCNGQSAPSFSAREDVRYGGYTLVATEYGVIASHPKAGLGRRLIPWVRVRYADPMDEPTRVDKRSKAYRESLPTKPEA